MNKDLISTNCNGEDGVYLSDKLKDFNMSIVKPYREEGRLFINRKIVNKEGEIVAGILASIYLWDCMYIDLFWVDVSSRKQGIGTRLLKEIETEAEEKKIRMIHLDTFDFQAKEFYEKNGYAVYGKLDDYPRGHCLYHMKKIIF